MKDSFLILKAWSFDPNHLNEQGKEILTQERFTVHSELVNVDLSTGEGRV